MGGKRQTRSRGSDTVGNNSPPATTVGTSRSVVNSVATAKINDDLLSLTKEQLKAECRRRGQKTTGTKIELLQRLGHKEKMAVNVKKNSHSANNSNGIGGLPTNLAKTALTALRARKQKDKEDRENLVIWRHPLKTIEYFCREVVVDLHKYGKTVVKYKKSVLFSVLSVLVCVVVTHLNGPHQYMIEKVYKKLLWCAYWTGLGVLSSVGLGTGLHTFLLYLGPHIAKVTLAAYECGGLNFPEPPYPDEIVCPSAVDGVAVTIFSIMSKVRLEAMCWGAGTALGELPPYFMARAARLSGLDPDDDDDLKEFEELQKKEIRHEHLTLVERGKLMVEHIVQKVGFLGILACASIPNPLFDLAGITCGHFLVPFWTFFGATLIGKAVIKMHIQKLFVIVAFNETLITTALEWLARVPVVGAKMQIPFRAFLAAQKLKLHQQEGSTGTSETGSLLSSIFEKFVFAMILYFVISIVNSFAQSYHKRIHQKKRSVD